LSGSGDLLNDPTPRTFKPVMGLVDPFRKRQVRLVMLVVFVRMRSFVMFAF
jgi:hypothetical protein